MSNLGQHDGDGIRYAMHLSAPKGGSAQMLRDPSGGWVSWEDYTRLKAEVERLTKGHSTDFVRAEMYRHLLEENAKLKEEVMRMRNDDYKEGDILQKCCEHQKNRIERLKAEVETLRNLGIKLESMIDPLEAENARLKAEVENSKRINTELLALSNRQASDIRRLTKAGDAMKFDCLDYLRELQKRPFWFPLLSELEVNHKSVQAWNSAKKGGQP